MVKIDANNIKHKRINLFSPNKEKIHVSDFVI